LTCNSEVQKIFLGVTGGQIRQLQQKRVKKLQKREDEAEQQERARKEALPDLSTFASKK